MKKLVIFLILFMFVTINTEGNEILLTKSKKSGKEKTLAIELNKHVKVFYVSEKLLTPSDRPVKIFYKQKKEDKFVGFAEGKLIEISPGNIVVQREFAKDLITIPVDNIFAIGKYNVFNRVATLTLIGIGSLIGTYALLEKQFGQGFDKTVFYMSFLVGGSTVIFISDKIIFPAKKIDNKHYRLTVSEK